PSDLSARSVIVSANKRCDQENTIAQLKACGALSAPLDSLASNGAYMAMASLAWTLKCWCGLMMRPGGRSERRAEQESARRRVIRMEFATFLNAFMLTPADHPHGAATGLAPVDVPAERRGAAVDAPADQPAAAL